MRASLAPGLAASVHVGEWREGGGVKCETVTCRTKLLEVVSEEVLPSERLKRLFLLAYFPCERPREKTERSTTRRSVQIYPDMFQKRKKQNKKQGRFCRHGRRMCRR